MPSCSALVLTIRFGAPRVCGLLDRQSLSSLKNARQSRRQTPFRGIFLFQHAMSSTTTVAQTRGTPASQILRLFPDVNPTVIGASASSSGDDVLEGYNEEQVRLMDEVCIVVDENDKPIGSGSKKTCSFASHRPIKCNLRKTANVLIRSSHGKHREGSAASCVLCVLV